jgi:prolyl-tRNA editing enzyme YbaK/EbsC (Cys-tRNA(Pro) deacylase)
MLSYNTTTEIDFIIDIPVVASRQKGAAEVRVFMLEDEREQLKQVCTKLGTNMSHLLRTLVLQWLDEQFKEKDT